MLAIYSRGKTTHHRKRATRALEFPVIANQCTNVPLSLFIHHTTVLNTECPYSSPLTALQFNSINTYRKKFICTLDSACSSIRNILQCPVEFHTQYTAVPHRVPYAIYCSAPLSSLCNILHCLTVFSTQYTSVPHRVTSSIYDSAS